MRSPSYGSTESIIFALTEQAKTSEGARFGVAALERANERFDRRFGNRSGPRLVATLESPRAPIIAAHTLAPEPIAEPKVELTEEERAAAVRARLDPELVLLMKVDPTGKLHDAEYLRRKAGGAALPAAGAAGEPIAAATMPPGAQLTEEELAAAARGRVDPMLMQLMKSDPSGRLLDAELERRKAARAK
jgi:hypothetical protein